MNIDKATYKEVTSGHTVVGTAAIKLTNSFPAYSGVLVRCPGPNDPGGGNLAPVWVGGSNVTADSAASGGIPILPGASLIIPIEDSAVLWCRSTSADQDIAWMVI